MKSLVVVGLVALVGLVAGAVVASDVHDVLREEWLAFKLQHRKQYAGAAEERARREEFLRSRLAVARHNQRHAQGLETYRLELNKFADVPQDEFQRLYTGFRPRRRSSAPRSEDWETDAWSANASDPLPQPGKYLDWRDSNAVTEVKNQSACASCWAFAATGAIESRRFLAKKVLQSLSEQNLVDCSRGYGNEGCSGGNADDAFMYVHDHGVAYERNYPYEAANGRCRFNGQALKPGTVAGFSDVRPFEPYLMRAVTAGPVAVGIEATKSFTLYQNGVFYDKNCKGNANHAVLVVGYGTAETGEHYWLVKNSWGLDWGERGYARMARNRNNNCDIATYASYPVIFGYQLLAGDSRSENRTVYYIYIET